MTPRTIATDFINVASTNDDAMQYLINMMTHRYAQLEMIEAEDELTEETQKEFTYLDKFFTERGASVLTDNDGYSFFIKIIKQTK